MDPTGILTERVAITHLGPPTANKMYLILRNGGHLGVPISDELVVFFHLVWLDVVEHDRVYVLPACENLREAALDIFVELSTLGSSVYERR